MINKKKLMKAAWDLARYAASQYGGKASDYISEALKLTWKEKREMISIEKLIELGGHEWERGDHHRIYFNLKELLKFYGLNLHYYNTGNISSASLDGEKISNNQAHKIQTELYCGKFWFDINDNQFYSKGISEYKANRIVENIKKEVEQL